MSQTKAELVNGLNINSALADAATIDSSGRLLVGKTTSKASDGENVAKAQIESTGNCMLDIAANGTTSSGNTTTPNSQELNVIFSEFNDRFELFAQEIALMKEQLLKLQTYTMDVNKVLYEERVRVLSNSESDTKISSDDSEPITDTVEAQTLNTSTLNDTSHTTSMNVLEELNTDSSN